VVEADRFGGRERTGLITPFDLSPGPTSFSPIFAFYPGVLHKFLIVQMII
jgi:hypothetical protein